LDREYTVLGDSDAVSLDRATAAVMRALPIAETCAKTIKLLQEETGETRTTIRRVLKTLETSMIGDGERGNPFRYWRKVRG
jgi:hypothetical protein